MQFFLSLYTSFLVQGVGNSSYSIGQSQSIVCSYGVCNCLLQKLQSVRRERGCRLVTCTRKYDHVTCTTAERSTLTPCSSTQKVQDTSFNFYVSLILRHHIFKIYSLVIVPYIHFGRHPRLFRANYNLMTYGARAFTVSAPELWKHLHIGITSCQNLDMFKSKLKTFLLPKCLTAKLLFLLCIMQLIFHVPHCKAHRALLYARYKLVFLLSLQFYSF